MLKECKGRECEDGFPEIPDDVRAIPDDVRVSDYQALTGGAGVFQQREALGEGLSEQFQ